MTMQYVSPSPNEVATPPQRRRSLSEDGAVQAQRRLSMLSQSTGLSTASSLGSARCKAEFHPLQDCENTLEVPTRVSLLCSSEAFSKKGRQQPTVERRKPRRQAPTHGSDPATVAALEAELAKARASAEAARSEAEELARENAALRNDVAELRSWKEQKAADLEADLIETNSLRAENEALRTKCDELLVGRNELTKRLDLFKVLAAPTKDEDAGAPPPAKRVSGLLSKFTSVRNLQPSVRNLQPSEEKVAVNPDSLLWDSFRTPETQSKWDV